jgi:RNA polymerase sigma-70 factor (ECF subfamily)
VTDVPEEADARLRERLIDGDDDALAEAYDRWSGLVHNLAARITCEPAAAEDITQEVFLHLWLRPDSFEPARGSLRSWLCVLARSRALDWVRRRAARARYQLAAANRGAVAQPELDDALIWQSETTTVRDAVRLLPADQRDAIELAYYQGYTYREVAAKLGIPEGTAKSRLRLALAAIANRLVAEGIADR